MSSITFIFAVPLVIAGAMIDPDGLHIGGLLVYTGIMLVALPFVAWPSFIVAGALPAAGESRARSVLSLWIGGSVATTAVISFLAGAMSYSGPGARIDLAGHLLIPYAPRAGAAIGLFALCMLVACGVAGAATPIVRREVAIKGALIAGCVLFGVLYGAGWLLVAG